jgi:hypothetical protein
MQLKIKCTSCKKVREATPEQTTEARNMGCYFSACCHAVATVERVTVRLPRALEEMAHALHLRNNPDEFAD